MQVLDTEIVGLVPLAALAESAVHYLQLRGFKLDEQVIETLVAAHGGGDGASAGPAGAGIGAMTVGGFLDQLASSQPTPGGGAVAALAGAAGAALLAMVARLTAGHKGYEPSAERMGEVVRLAERERATLLDLADRDTAAFDAVMAALRRPRHSDAEREARTGAVQAALAAAAQVPLEVARRAAAILPLAHELVETGNANAVSDALSAGQMLHAAVAGALANVAINVVVMTDAAPAAALSDEAAEVRKGAAAALAAVEQAFDVRLSSRG